MSNLFIVILTEQSTGTPLRLHPFKDMDEVNSAISWQVKGGWPRSCYVVASPDKKTKGVMLTEDGQAILVHNSGWKADSYARFIAEEWGE
jgi:hypothetical protein